MILILQPSKILFVKFVQSLMKFFPPPVYLKHTVSKHYYLIEFRSLTTSTKCRQLITAAEFRGGLLIDSIVILIAIPIDTKTLFFTHLHTYQLCLTKLPCPEVNGPYTTVLTASSSVSTSKCCQCKRQCIVAIAPAFLNTYLSWYYSCLVKQLKIPPCY